MIKIRRAGVAFVAFVLLAGSAPGTSDSDPVVAARAQRAAAQGLSEDDLPPVPKGIVEPPPLPPPEIHPKDLRPRRGARKAKGASTKKGTASKKPATKKGAAPKRSSAAKRSVGKAPAAKAK
jgi:hypothetical protein